MTAGDAARVRPDVTDIADLSTADDSVAVAKRLLADVVASPTLGTTSTQPQTNPLLDHVEGQLVGISLISDDNSGATPTTRVLNLAVAVWPPLS